MEFFEALKTFLIDTRNEGIKEVAGTELTDGFFAYKKELRGKAYWVITDIASGTSIPGDFPTLKACKEFMANVPEEIRQKIDFARSTESYKVQCEKIAAYKPTQTEDYDFDNAYDELSDLYDDTIEQLPLFEKKNKGKDSSKQSNDNNKKDWKTYFFKFNDLRGVSQVSEGIFKPLISAEFMDGFYNFVECYGNTEANTLISKLNRIIQTFEINGRSRPGDSEKVNGVDHPIYELKIGETASKKPIRSLYFIKTDTDGVKYVIFASLFVHTNKNLTSDERNSGKNAYLLANPRN